MYELTSIFDSPPTLRTLLCVPNPSHCCVYPSQTVNSWLFAAARTPSERQCVAILDKYMKPLKPQAYASLMARDPKQWAHWAQPLEVVCADQVTNNSAESTMNMIGHAVRRYGGGFLFGFLSRCFLSFPLFLCSGNISLGEVMTRLGTP